MNYAHSYWECFNSIINEGLYYTFFEGFPFESTQEFLQKTYDYAIPFVMAIDTETNQVVGWCDAQMQSEKLGMLGMGIHADYREQKLGTRLIAKLLDEAKKYGYEKIFLRARHTNDRAINLYKKMGFNQINIVKCGVPYDEKHFDIIEMELIF